MTSAETLMFVVPYRRLGGPNCGCSESLYEGSRALTLALCYVIVFG